MRFLIVCAPFAGLILGANALADSTAYAPIATGFSLPDADAANTAAAAQTANYATTAGSAGFAASATSATSANYASSAGTARSATSAATADSAAYATSAGIASQAAGLTAGNNCPAGTALSVTKGVLGCVSSVTSISGNLNGAQIVGSITNATNINIDGSIVSGGNIVADGYVNGHAGLYSSTGVYATDYYGRAGGANANFNGTATTANSAGYATSAGSANYAENTDVGVLYQHGSSGDGSSFYCDSGYHLVFYDLNVFSTNNAFFYECVRNGN